VEVAGFPVVVVKFRFSVDVEGEVVERI